jgi:uncharacterized protein (DUF1800 family)
MSDSSLWNDPERAWARYEPNAESPWDLARVAHLHRRAGFLAPWGVLQRDLKDGPEASIARLLDGEPTAADGRPASEFDALVDEMARQLAPGAGLTRLQALWLYRMVFTGHPLRERMTLFWHNHFATSETKVQNPALMQRQQDLLRENALGDFGVMLRAISKDPAMLIWLDAKENRKAHPNENYAREVMELFTLGRGRYSEKDIQEAARAFTGWFVIRDAFQDLPGQHDDGAKSVLGRSGKFRGDDMPEILLAQPACAEFVCGKLVKAFVTETDDIAPALVAPLAKAFREANYDVKVPLATILKSRLFFDASVRRHRIKSPVEFTVGTVRALEVVKPTVQADALAESCARMGQGLFAPPSVAGWEGGPAWANSTTMLHRTNFALAVLSTENAALGKRLDPLALARRHGATPGKEVARFYTDLLVQDGFDPKVRATVEAAAIKQKDPAVGAREAATLILTAPEYHLA